MPYDTIVDPAEVKESLEIENKLLLQIKLMILCSFY